MKIGINLHKRILLIYRSYISTRNLLFVLFLLIAFPKISFSKNYYFSSSSGNDSYSATQAQNPATPWKTIEKLNNSMSFFNPGDSILFKRGEEFTGQIILTRSGTSVARLVISAYGTGKEPVIKGTMLVTGWTQYQGNIWVADCPKLSSTPTNFFINGKSQQIGRYPNADAPNKGYLNIDSHIGTTSLTNSSLSSMPDWIGGEAVVRSSRWILDRVPIKSQRGGTLVFSSPTTYEIQNNYGFFIQNHLNTLDSHGEWYFNSTTKKIYLFSIIDPNTLITEVPSFNSVFSSESQKYYKIENIQFSGSVDKTLTINNSEYIEIKNTTISGSGIDAVSFAGCTNIIFSYNNILNTNNNAVIFYLCNSVRSERNKIKNAGVRPGMGLSQTGQYSGMILKGNNNQCKSNIIDSVGYVGLLFDGSYVRIINNMISNFCMTLDDGGGIYTWSDGKSICDDRQIESNIVLSGIGAGEGTNEIKKIIAEGIYMDERTMNVKIINNTVTNCSGGVLIHNASNISVIGNTLFDNIRQFIMSHNGDESSHQISNCIVKDNIFFSKTESQTVAVYQTIKNDIRTFGLIDNNYYCRPADESATIFTRFIDNSVSKTDYLDLSDWISIYHHDQNSAGSPRSIKAYKVLELLGQNKVINGQFKTGIETWNSWSDYDNGSVSWDNSNILEGGALKMNFSGLSSKCDGRLFAYTNIGNLVAGKHYILRFSAITSDAENKMDIYLKNNATPYNLIAESRNVILNTIKTGYEILLTPEVSSSLGRLDFKINENKGSVWLDNIEFYEADISLANINDSIKFVLNSSSTNKVVQLNGSYIDTKGTKYQGSVSLLPFTSVVLIADSNPVSTPAIPSYVSSVIEDTSPSKIELNYSLTLANITPSPSAFSVRVNSTDRSVNSVLISGTQVILTLSEPVSYGNTVTVAYTQPSTNPLQTTAGGKATSFAPKTVTNRVNAVDPPVIVTPPPSTVVPNTPPIPVVSYEAENYSGFKGVLDASGSYDTDNDKLSYSWKIPDNIPVSSKHAAIIEFLAPVIQDSRVYEFVLTVSDGKASKSMNIPIEVLPYKPDLKMADIVIVEATAYDLNDEPSLVLDGNTNTMWSCKGEEQYLLLKLKSRFNITHIMLSFHPEHVQESVFDILCSFDGKNWDLIFEKAKSCPFSGNLQIFNFPDAKPENEYRFVKLVGHGNSVDNWNYVSEVRIFGYPHTYPTEYGTPQVKIYPNPANELVNIVIDEPNYKPDFIRIVSLAGEMIYNDRIDPEIRQLQVPVNFMKGVYIIQMGTGEITSFSHKLIVIN